MQIIPTLFCSLQTDWIYNSTFTNKSTPLKGKKTPIHTFSRHPSITISLGYDIVLRIIPSINKRNLSPGVEKAFQIRSVRHRICQDQPKQLDCWRRMKVFLAHGVAALFSPSKTDEGDEEENKFSSPLPSPLISFNRCKHDGGQSTDCPYAKIRRHCCIKRG